MYRMSPSSSVGMNSWPSWPTSGMAETIANRPMASVERGLRRATYTNGSYTLRMAREMGCSLSLRMRPRIKRSRSAGANVMDSKALANMTKVLV